MTKPSLLRPALTLFLLLSLVTGVAYPLLITGVAQAAFPEAANGSLIVENGRSVGSALIGQSFRAPGHFWGRPSATAPNRSPRLLNSRPRSCTGCRRCGG